MIRSLTAMLLLTLCAGCATAPPTAGDRMLDQAAGTESLGKQWNSGAQLAQRAGRERERAQRALSDAQDELPRARAALANAERDQALGESMMREAEAEYSRRFPGRSLRDAPHE